MQVYRSQSFFLCCQTLIKDKERLNSQVLLTDQKIYVELSIKSFSFLKINIYLSSSLNDK